MVKLPPAPPLVRGTRGRSFSPPPCTPDETPGTPRRLQRMKGAAQDELRRIPGVGVSIAADLRGLGIRAVEDLRGADPQALYDRLCARTGVRVDRCMLYVLRCAVYYASEFPHDPELLKWWSWKDGGAAYQGRG